MVPYPITVMNEMSIRSLRIYLLFAIHAFAGIHITLITFTKHLYVLIYQFIREPVGPYLLACVPEEKNGRPGLVRSDQKMTLVLL